MRLKSSEKRLLLILLLAIVSYFGLTYIVFPILDENALISEEYLNIQSDHNDLKKNELTNNQLKEVLDRMTKQYDQLATLLPSQVYQEESILFLTDLAAKNSMTIDSYDFTFTETNQIVDANAQTVEKAPVEQVLQEFQKMLNGDQSANVSQYKDKIYQAPSEDETKLSQYEKDLKYFNVQMELSGTYKDFKNYIASLESYKHKIIIKQININKDNEALDRIIGSVAISYPIYYDEEELKPFEWQYEKAPINSDPFLWKVVEMNTVPTNNTTPSITETTLPTEPSIAEPTKAYAASDFYMALNPASSDANTLSMGKSPFRYTALYADNDGIETATLKLRKFDGKYQYQYSTSLQTYPGENEWNDFELMAKDKLVLEVQSALRLPSGDNSGVLLNVSNDTGMTLSIYTYSDDPTRPRLTVNRLSGKVNTIKE